MKVGKLTTKLSFVDLCLPDSLHYRKMEIQVFHRNGTPLCKSIKGENINHDKLKAGTFLPFETL